MNATRFLPCVAVALMALISASCSNLPTQPLSADNDHRTAESGTIRDDIPGDPGDAGNYNVGRIDGAVGGSVSFGRFTVEVPAGAFQGVALITVGQPDLAQPVVDLSINGAKNDFQVPVTLIAALSDVSAERLEASGMAEFTAAGWQQMTGEKADAYARTISVSLEHFSTYRVELPAGPTDDYPPSDDEPIRHR